MASNGRYGYGTVRHGLLEERDTLGRGGFHALMSAGYSRRIWIGLVLIALFVGVSQLQALRSAFAAYRTLGRPDEVSRHEARLQALRRALPSHGVVGYVSDAPGAGMDPASSEARQAFKRYLLTQYALAPSSS